MTNLQSFMAQSIPSVPIPSGHLSGICHFVLEKLQMPHDGAPRSYKNATVRLKNRVQMPHPRTTTKLYFPVNKLQIPYLWEISKNLIKTHEASYAKSPQSLGRELMERKPHKRIILKHNYKKYSLQKYLKLSLNRHICN